MKIMRKLSGVTLLEILLVLVIASAIMLMTITIAQQKLDEARRVRVTYQMQQILNAGLSFYLAHTRWPDTFTELQPDYIPQAISTNPYAEHFTLIGGVAQSNEGLPSLYVTTNVKTTATAQVVAGSLPFGFVSDADGASHTPPDQGNCAPSEGPLPATCTYVVSSVNIPGQNLNNATAINRAGLYHSGACVPTPVCPLAAMRPEIIVVPAQVNGVFEKPGTGSTKMYPLSSFTAFAKGPHVSAGMANCSSNGSSDCASGDAAVTFPENKQFWRVCLQVETEKGKVVPADASWGQKLGTILAVTRCAMPNESRESSNFTVWSE